MLPRETNENKVSSPWFQTLSDALTAKTYMVFIVTPCKMSQKQKQIRPLEKVMENDE